MDNSYERLMQEIGILQTKLDGFEKNLKEHMDHEEKKDDRLLAKLDELNHRLERMCETKVSKEFFSQYREAKENEFRNYKANQESFKNFVKWLSGFLIPVIIGWNIYVFQRIDDMNNQVVYTKGALTTVKNDIKEIEVSKKKEEN